MHIQELMEDFADVNRGLLRVSRISKVSPDVPALLVGDKRLLFRVLFHLLEVSVHFYPEMLPTRNLDVYAPSQSPLFTVLSTDVSSCRLFCVAYAQNADKFTRQGEVRLTVTSANNDRYKFDVSDTGPGLNEAAVNAVFQK